MTNRNRGRILSTAAVAAFIVGAPGAALAQAGASDAGEIVVTAQRRSEKSVDVPISVASLGADALQTARVDELSDITALTPGLRFDFSSGFFQPTIRGVGTAVVTSGGGGNVGIYVDGFYSPNPLAVDFDLMRVESIQVLKGPQGTLFGRNTTGGAILVQTSKPSTETGGEVQASYGRYNEAKLQGYATVGLSENVALDVEGMYRRGDGWRRDIMSGKRVGDYENWMTRIGLWAQAGENVEILLRYQHNDMDDPANVITNSWIDPVLGGGQPSFAPPGFFTYGKNEVASGAVPKFFRSKSDVVQATIKADLGFADLTSYSQYRRENVDSSIDLDHSGVEIFQLGLPNRNRTWSQEFLLNSKPGTPLQWTVGLFYFSNTDTYITHIDNFGSAPSQRIRLGGSSTTAKSYAAFADATYEITPQIFVTAGLRYAQDKVVKAYWNPQFNPIENSVPSISDGRLTPRFVLRYKPTDDLSLYGSFTRGYKSAIIDVGGSCQNAPFICNQVKPETIDAFEAGVKYDGDGFSVEVAGFHYNYKNLQVSLFRAGTAEIINAAKSRIYGLDGQVRYEVSPAFSVNLGAAWTKARYRRFDNAPIYTSCSLLGQAVIDTCLANGLSFLVLGQNLRNTTMQRTPEFTGNIGARYAADLAGGELVLSGNLYHSSKFFFGPSGVQFPQKAYQTLALRAQWTDPSERFTLAAYGDNVTNSRYRTGAQYTNFAIGSNWNKPATYGVEFGVKF